MRITMRETYGVFEEGKTYDIAQKLADTFLREDRAEPARKSADVVHFSKNMKPGQVKKRGGLDGGR